MHIIYVRSAEERKKHDDDASRVFVIIIKRTQRAESGLTLFLNNKRGARDEDRNTCCKMDSVPG
jgi:hypothetical protein